MLRRWCLGRVLSCSVDSGEQIPSRHRKRRFHTLLSMIGRVLPHVLFLLSATHLQSVDGRYMPLKYVDRIISSIWEVYLSFLLFDSCICSH